jgi:hypothetical protein
MAWSLQAEIGRNVPANHCRGIERSRRSNGTRREMAGDDSEQLARSKRMNAPELA